MIEEHNWPTPKVVQWMATLRCPHACEHCMVHSTEPCTEMSTSHVEDLVYQVNDMGVPEFLITGGEPMVREDLPDIIALLKRLEQRWTLNTAVLPGPTLRQSLASAPPAFVAMSLDGPIDVHDVFRRRKGSYDEILEAIQFYRSIGSDVGIGTTIAQSNLGRLDELLETVKRSGAASWGLHMPVPEGRAVGNKALSISDRQVRKLYKWVIDTRREFPVELTDSFGSCGDRELLVRNVPVKCGAGTKQCVVLPDGEVVPCLTLDRTTSAGNVLDTGLRTIWNDGFDKLRQWRPKHMCGHCGKAEKCREACWLMRKNGHGCLDTGSLNPRLLKTAAGLIVSASALQSSPCHADEPRQSLETEIVRWYAEQAGETTPKSSKLLPQPVKEPGRSFFENRKDDKLPKGLKEQCAAIDKTFSADLHSQSLIALMWRSLAETCMRKKPGDRTNDERKALIATSAKLRKAYDSRVIAPKLELISDRKFEAQFARMHIAPLPRLRNPIELVKPGSLRFDVSLERRKLEGKYPMRMVIAFEDDQSLSFVGPRRMSTVSSGDILGVFDVIHVPKGGATIQVAQFGVEGKRLTVKLPEDVELTYVDLVNLTGDQNAKVIADWTKQGPLARPKDSWDNANPLLFRSVRKALKVGKWGDESLTDAQKRTLTRWMIDFWTF